LTLRDPASGAESKIAKENIEVRKEIGTLMPNGIAEAMTPEQKRDLIRFLLELGKQGAQPGEALLAHTHTVETFPIHREPIRPELWPNFNHPVNRNRLYDFYAQEAIYFAQQNPRPALIPAFPGLDGGKMGHWGNQNEVSWADDRWNETDLGSLQCGVFRSNRLIVPRGMCVRFGAKGEMAACFNPETLCYEALWQGGFVKFSSVRHGFMDGLRPAGTLLPRPAGQKPDKPFEYRGLYRSGSRVVFAYRIDGIDYLDSPTVENGKFVRQVAPAAEHPLKDVVKGGKAQWPDAIETKGTLGAGGPYVVDTIAPPFTNPWKSLCFFGDHDFLPDGSAMICTMEGDVWHVTGLDDKLEHVRWRRFATGLHQALGLVVADGSVYVLGRDQITRLYDLNNDGEADYYERFSACYATSTAGHDFICGLQRDAAGRFYTASGNQGLLQISSDGKDCRVLATGFRNPDGLCLRPDGTLTIPCSEGEWTPCSMICEFSLNQSQAPKKIGGHQPPYFGYGGPKQGKAPDLPMIDIPRGIDNSSGGQVFIDSDRWGPLTGQMVHLSYGAGTHFLLLRDEVAGQPQGALVPLDGEFRAGVHRGRFNPKDGQLYVSGMAGWGTYTPDEGCFQRVRYTGGPVQLPRSFQAKENGILVSFTSKIDPKIASDTSNYFLQAWNYRYSAGYGSQEYSTTHYGTIGHDVLEIKAVHLLPDGFSLFLEVPDLQPSNQVYLRYRVDSWPARDIFATVHDLGAPFVDIPGYRPVKKTIAAHPILTDISVAAKSVPNPYRKAIGGARAITIEAGKNLSFVQRTLKVKIGESIKLTFSNPDVVPHNWALVKPDSRERVGDFANKLIADPDAVAQQYIPKSDDVLFFTDIVPANGSFTIYFKAPLAKGSYPYICTFPGHWMVMNGELIVE
jgi:azurin